MVAAPGGLAHIAARRDFHPAYYCWGVYKLNLACDSTNVFTYASKLNLAPVYFRGCELPLGHFFSVTPP